MHTITEYNRIKVNIIRGKKDSKTEKREKGRCSSRGADFRIHITLLTLKLL